MGFRVWGLGFGFGVGLRLRVWGRRAWGSGSGFRVWVCRLLLLEHAEAGVGSKAETLNHS